MKNGLNNRTAGVLMPVSSLPGPYGIGCFGKEARKFVDFLADAGQSFWQILPMGQTGYGDSPYQSCSTFAGNPYFIDIREFIDNGYLSESDIPEKPYEETKVNYGRLYRERYAILKTAYNNSPYSLTAGESSDRDAFERFCKDNSWLYDYALYNAIKDREGGVSFMEWPQALCNRDERALVEINEKLSSDIRFYEFVQYYFTKQWKALKAYANGKGISIIGDIPIYVALDSADVWSDRKLFKLDDNGNPVAVAGCPPDAFAATGQLWGNPLYDWEYHKKTGFDWWIKRLSRCFELYDVVRIDHFRGFESYYAIPFGDPTAENGHWEKGPGIDFVYAIRKALPEAAIIAEDLGYLTPEVHELLAASTYPGMKILQFAFDSREAGNYLPYTYPKNCVVYTGTHDNETMKGWIDTVDKENLDHACDYLGVSRDDPDLTWKFIRCALASTANTAIIPVQDYLGLGSDARINTPSTLGTNWLWRMKENALTADLARRIRHVSDIYGRIANDRK